MYRRRLVSALGTPLDGKGSLGDEASEPRSLESRAPSILNQTDVLCVYVAVGQKTSTVDEMISGLAARRI